MQLYKKGDFVMDVPRNLVGQVKDVHGNLLTLAWPGSRTTWEQDDDQCRTASLAEREQVSPSPEIRSVGAPSERPPSS